MKLALIGKNISHSRSQEVYEKILGRKISYDLLDISEEKSLPSPEELFKKYHGVSITSPYKKNYLSKVILDKKTEMISSLNCLYKKEEKIYGTNTDYLALREMLKKMAPKKIAILGDGVMAHLSFFVSKELGFFYESFSRKKSADLSTLDYSSFDLLINACSRDFIFKGHLSEKTLFWDFNYDLCHSGRIISYQDGKDLLFLQAKYALSFF